MHVQFSGSEYFRIKVQIPNFDTAVFQFSSLKFEYLKTTDNIWISGDILNITAECL
jgi:hypothetical protein